MRTKSAEEATALVHRQQRNSSDFRRVGLPSELASPALHGTGPEILPREPERGGRTALTPPRVLLRNYSAEAPLPGGHGDAQARRRRHRDGSTPQCGGAPEAEGELQDAGGRPWDAADDRMISSSWRPPPQPDGRSHYGTRRSAVGPPKLKRNCRTPVANPRMPPMTIRMISSSWKTGWSKLSKSAGARSRRR